MTYREAKDWGRSLVAPLIIACFTGAVSAVGTVSAIDVRADSLRRDVQRHERSIRQLQEFHYGPKEAYETHEPPENPATLEADRPFSEALRTAS